jgi:hypothetical protein
MSLTMVKDHVSPPYIKYHVKSDQKIYRYLVTPTDPHAINHINHG